MSKQLTVILENAPDCELDRKEISIADDVDDDTIDLEIGAAIESWTLRVGDTIKIRVI